ncbi:MAG: Uma2 family endonuclease [Spirochaetaceae bacterium]
MAIVVNRKTKLTYEDYVHFPDDGRIHELIDGDHYVSPAPGTGHQRVSRRIQFQLYEQLEKPGLAEVFNAPTDVHLTEIDVVQPDLAVIDLGRKHIISPKKINAAPELVVEILSDSTATRDLSLKRDLYQRAGVPEYWIVDPEANEVRPFRLSADGVYEALPAQRERIEFHTERLNAVVDLTQVW